MAHEISHSFDELGNIYDAHGRLGNWWTAEDRSKFRKTAEQLIQQFNQYCSFPDACVDGKQVSSENIADLAGLQVAHDAYILSLKGKSDVAIGGLSGEQRFFLAFAPMTADLNAAPFPADWTVYVACDVGTWQSIKQRVGGVNTDAALTDRQRKVTVVNGLLYNPLFSFAGYVQKTPEGILRHELGHITCNTPNEDLADRYARTGTCRKH